MTRRRVGVDDDRHLIELPCRGRVNVRATRGEIPCKRECPCQWLRPPARALTHYRLTRRWCRAYGRRKDARRSVSVIARRGGNCMIDGIGHSDGLVTANDLLTLDKAGKSIELVRGRLIVREPPSTYHGRVQGILHVLVGSYVRTHALGAVFGQEYRIQDRVRSRHRARAGPRVCRSGPGRAHRAPRISGSGTRSRGRDPLTGGPAGRSAYEGGGVARGRR